MRFLLDQDVYASTRRFLEELGHDVIPVAALELSEAEDEVLLSAAEDRLLVTRDRDFGNLVFVRDRGVGVLYLRMLPSTATAVHAELEKVTTSYTEEELMRAFLVVEPGRHWDWTLASSRRNIQVEA